MKLDIRSFFVGIATVLAILAVGFGGGVMMGGVLSGDSKTLDKVERQAAKGAPADANDREVKPTTTPVVVAPAQGAPGETAATTSPPQPAVATPSPPAQPTDPTSQQAAAPPAPTLVEKPVALTQPAEAAQPQLTPREAARQRREQWREERARQREEWRQKYADQRREYQRRRDEQRGRPQQQEAEADDNIETAPVYVRPRGPFDGLFGPRNDGPFFMR